MSWNKKKTFLDLINVYSSCSFQGIWFNFPNFLWLLQVILPNMEGLSLRELSSQISVRILSYYYSILCERWIADRGLQTMQRGSVAKHVWGRSSTKGNTKESWMISRKQGFLAVVWFDSSPAPRFPPQIWCKILLIFTDRVSLHGIYVRKTKTLILCPWFCY